MQRLRPLATLLALVVLGVCSSAALQASAQDPQPIRFMRQPVVSPDGKRVAFSYQGDIWTVPIGGGTASRITLHEAHDQTPSWSPDGRQIAFSSKREGSYDVWVIPAEGGKARRLTYHSGDDIVNGWSPDGAEVLFVSVRETTRYAGIYAVNVNTGNSRLIAAGDQQFTNAAFSPDGRQVALTAGGSWTRRHYRGSANANLMLYPASGQGAGQWLTRDPENERWPIFSPDGKALYFVSDRTGSGEIWRMPLDTRKPVQLTPPGEADIYYPSLTHKGDRLVYERGFRLWTMSTRSGDPEEIKVYAPSDDRTNPVRKEAFTSGAQEAQLSPDGKQLAVVVHGELFVMPAAGGEMTRLTETPQREEDANWSPDSKRIAFTSDRDGNSDLFVVNIADKKTTRLTQTPHDAENAPVFSPDGKTIAFRRGANGAELCLIPSEGGEVRSLVRDPTIYSVSWSRDSRWLAYGRLKSHSGGSVSEVFLLNAAEPDAKPINISRYPGRNLLPAWSGDGKRLCFLSDRTQTGQLYSVPLADPRLADEAEKPSAASPSSAGTVPQAATVKIDFEDIHQRARQLSRSDADLSAYAVSPDGSFAVFAAPQLGRTDLWRVPTAGGVPTRLTQTGEPADDLQFSPDGQRLYYRSAGGIRMLALTGPSPAAPVTVPFRAEMEIDTRAEMTQLFDEAWRKMRDIFYDEKMHGVDWNHVRDVYRPVVAEITMKEDFYTLFTLALGELNASHTGISGDATTPRGTATASLGIAIDPAWSGPGVRVKSVMPKGPADRPSSRLSEGDVILRVDGAPVTNSEEYYRLLGDKAAKKVEVLASATGAEEGARKITMRPISLAEYKELEYERWVKEREAIADRSSGGKIGYIHLNAMNPANLEKFKRLVFGDMQSKDGLVLDVRFNGGGSIADELLSILQDKVFSYRTFRGDPVRSTAPITAWNRPTLVLINEASFSNAEAFPWGFKDLKLGKVVGVPTYGAVIGTGGTTLIDGSSLRTPTVGAYTLDGTNMENHGCPPDILVENTPEDWHSGKDRQLERGVEELLKGK